MKSFFKSFGLGLLYTVLSPFFVLYLVLYAIYGIFAFIILGIRGIVLYFMGRSIFKPLQVDIEAEAILNQPKIVSERPTPTPPSQPDVENAIEAEVH
jgi:hypothetical protein